MAERIYLMNAMHLGTLTGQPPVHRQMVESLTFA